MTTIDDPPITDEELTALALAADADVELGDDAVPWRPLVVGEDSSPNDGLLPDWYMPTPHAGRHSWRARVAVGAIILSLLVINAYGLCITYGHLVAA